MWVIKDKPLCASIPHMQYEKIGLNFFPALKLNHSPNLEIQDLSGAGKQMWLLFRKLLVFTFTWVVYDIVQQEKIPKTGIWASDLFSMCSFHILYIGLKSHEMFSKF